MKKNKLFVICLLFLTLTSCAELNPFKKVDFYIDDNFTSKIPNTVVILPFKNETNNHEAPDVLRKSFYEQFSSKKFKDIELSDVDSILKQSNLKDEDIRIENSEFLGQTLKADALIYGDIKKYQGVYLVLYSYITMELNLKMVNSETGEILWEANHSTKSFAGDLPSLSANAIMELIPTLILGPFKAIWNLRRSEYIRTSDDLCKSIADTIPYN